MKNEPCKPKAGASEQEFVRGLLIRGEAVKPGAGGKLPSGATHEIVEKHPGGSAPSLPDVRRRRFSAF